MAELKTCQRCKSERVLRIRARAKDMHQYELGDRHYEGYGGLLGQSDGDAVDIRVCLECGQTQGTFPEPLTFMDPDYVEDE